MERIAIVGGGPAGLYFAYLWKRRHPDAIVEVFERRPAHATWGFGVLFPDRAVDCLRADDPETIAAMARGMERSDRIKLSLNGQCVDIEGAGSSAIGRLALLQILQRRARAVGAICHFATPVRSVDQLADYDLIVAADGLNSIIRRGFEGDFGTSTSHLRNKFVCYGTNQRFETLSQTFVQTGLGVFSACHYRYSPTMSTFLVECDGPTWTRHGFAGMSEEQSKAVCEQVFADILGDRQLISNGSVWRNFRWLRNESWWFRNIVLIGDAARTVHHSTGPGICLAMADAIALACALEEFPGDLGSALESYQVRRQPVAEEAMAASRRCADWHEALAEHVKSDLADVVTGYIASAGYAGIDN